MKKPHNYQPLLSIDSDAKTIKGHAYGYLTGILYLAPADSSGVMNTCPSASEGCKAACLFTAGRAGFTPNINIARVRKTKFMVEQPEAFIASLCHDIAALVRKAKREGLIPCVRVNGTSDLPKLARQMALEFPEVTFYDYTKHPRSWERTLPNYSLTFSHSEVNLLECMQALAHGINVAVVFDTRKGQPLPETWHGYRVVDGDLSDLRFTDPVGVVVGLRAKGKAKKDSTGFVERLVSIQPLAMAA